MSKQPGGYPRQPQYPQQQYYQGMPQQPYPQYPQQQGYAPQGQPMPPSGYGVAQSPYGVPPPPYTATPQQPPAYHTHQQMQHVRPVGMPMVQGNFDSGARFHQGVPPSVPPPPPGCPPTGAQVATAQGQSVAMQQNQAGWFSGGTDGGYTIW